MELIKYDAACRAVAEAKTLDDVKEIKNLSEAARAYAKMAKNRTMEIDAIELRVRAERKEGEIIQQLKQLGIGRQGNQNSDPSAKRITLKELGIDGNDSAIAQRLASLPESRFSTELAEWRATAPTAIRLETPLQRYRVPSVRGDRQKAAAKQGRSRIDASDPLDKFRAPDGRRIGDWRAGELRRIAELADRVGRCVDTLLESMPVANPEPLATMEMLFDRAALVSLLEEIWEAPIDPADAGINQARIDASRARRERACEQCGKSFLAHRPGSAARSGLSANGRFCSRGCQADHFRAVRRPQSGELMKCHAGT